MRAAGLVAAGMATTAALGARRALLGRRRQLEQQPAERGRAARRAQARRHADHAVEGDDTDSLDPGVTYSVSGTLLARATQRMVLSFRPNDPTHPIARPRRRAARPISP